MADIRRLEGDPPSPAEAAFGFSRAVVVDGWAIVGGTTSAGPGATVIGETPAEQAREVLRRLLHELSRTGAMAEDVVSVRAYVTDISRAEEVGRAFADVFGTAGDGERGGGGGPLFTMVEVSGLIDPRMSVEMEATARLPS